jgi:hypothetical protein
MSGRRGATAARRRGTLACNTCCLSTTEATSRSAAGMPLELCGAWTPEISRGSVHGFSLALWPTDTRSLPAGHHASQKAAFSLRPASAGAQTRAETSGTSTGSLCRLMTPKNLYLKGALGLSEAGNERLLEYLRPREVLLVLDNTAGQTMTVEQAMIEAL